MQSQKLRTSSSGSVSSLAGVVNLRKNKENNSVSLTKT